MTDAEYALLTETLDLYKKEIDVYLPRVRERYREHYSSDKSDDFDDLEQNIGEMIDSLEYQMFSMLLESSKTASSAIANQQVEDSYPTERSMEEMAKYYGYESVEEWGAKR